MKLTGEEDETQQLTLPTVKRAVQIVLKTARQGVVPLCKEIARMVKENFEMKARADEFEAKYKSQCEALANSRPIRDSPDYAQIYTSDSMKMEPSPTSSNPDHEMILNSNMSTTVDHVNSSVGIRQLPDLPDTFPGPIIGCVCTSCKTFFRSANGTGAGVGNLGSLSGHPVIQSSIKKFKSDLNKLTLLRFDMKYFKWKSNSGQKAFKHG